MLKSNQAHVEGCANLGRIVYCYQHMEDELRSAVSFLIDTEQHEPGAIVTAELSMRQLVSIGYSMFDLFVESKTEDRLKRWRKLLGEVLEAEATRNQILHSNYGVNVGLNPKFFRAKTTAKFRKGLRVDVANLDSKFVSEVIVEFGRIHLAITEFMNECFPGWHLRHWRRNKADLAD